MADKDKRREKGSAEKRATEARKRAQQDQAALDNPDVADEPSEIRNGLYFVAVVAFGLALNVVALLIVSGGQ